MVDSDQGEAAPLTLLLSAKKKELLSTAMKRTNEWILSQEIPSDVTVHAGGTAFPLHKFPLVSKSGYIRKLVSESSDPDLSVIELRDIPGGAEAFELAAKFCYGINFEISGENVAVLRCVSEFLEMTEDYASGNLATLTEKYITEVSLKSLPGALSVLRETEHLLPVAETTKLMSRCIDTIAYVACEDSRFSTSDMGSGLEGAVSSPGMNLKPPATVDWWAEDLTALRIETFQRVLIAMMARGFKHYALGPILMLYAQKSLRSLELFGKGRKKIEPKQEHEKRVVLETIVGLLPREKNAMSVSFLSVLLRAAIYLETTVACRLDLEKRMGLQLGQAVLDDLLIPSFYFTGDTLFDVDSVQRILMNFLDSDVRENHLGHSGDGEFGSPLLSDLERVGKLMESYLAEIASDRNLSVSKFISLAELIPEHSRATEDGMYRSIDIFLKAHPALSDLERKKVCSVMDCQKLSREACAHAAQNNRLPVQTVVQVLYYEQQRLREVVSTGGSLSGAESPAQPPRDDLYTPHLDPASNELSKLKRENQELKFELLKMKMRLKEMEKPSGTPGTMNPTRGSVTYSADKPPLPRKSFITSVSKKLGKLMRTEGLMTPKRKAKPAKDRRHSIG